MKKRQLEKRLTLSRETIRQMVSEELQNVAGGGPSCGGVSACDCSYTSATTFTEGGYSQMRY